MTISDLKGKKITVMGLGLHGGGVGTVRFLSQAGARVTVTDIKSKEELAPSLFKLKDLKNINYVFNQHRSENFTASDMIIKNPAAPWSNKYIQLAIKNKIPVEMDSSLFFKFSKNPIVGVTGTKGKTTTTSLIYEILLAAGKNALKVGVGQASVLDKIKDLKKDSLPVFELSSWRMAGIGRAKMSPRFAVITNISPDHLNYYKSMKEYVEDKKQIFLNQKKSDFCIINADNEIIRDFEGEIKSNVVKFSRQKISSGKAVYIDNQTIYYNNGIDEKKVMEIKDVNLRGEHNLENVLAATAVGIVMGISFEVIRKAVSEFRGVAHRLEFVRDFGGVKFYNDTAATIPDSAVSALNSFSEPVILIAGGSDKNLDVSKFAEAILEKTKNFVFLKGKATEKIIAAIKKIHPELDAQRFKAADSMEEAVELARKHARPGDVVLLSPGAASFGLFANEFDRGEKFRKIVQALK